MARPPFVAHAVMLTFLYDLRSACRALLQRPGFSTVAIVTLALGIGANAIIFSVTHALLKPLPYREPDRLVMLQSNNPEMKIDSGGLAVGDFQDLRQRSRTLEGLAANFSTIFDLTGTEKPEVVYATRVSSNLFPLLGVRAVLGRTFLPEEETLGRDHVVLLSDGFWHSHFGASPSILGQSLELGGKKYQIVGVLPPGFSYPQDKTSLWVPLAFPPGFLDRRSHFLQVVGRLREGSSLEQASQELTALTRTLQGEHPDTNRNWTARPISLLNHVVGKFRPALLTLTGAVGLLLLIACANLVNLLLARGLSRSRETAIRAALGAARPRLVSHFLTESLLLSGAGGVLGLLLARWGVGLLVAARPEDLPRAAEIGVDHTVILFGLLLSLIAGLAFGAVPALQLSRPDLNVSHKGDEGAARSRLRSAFVVSEVALSLVLLIAAALMFQGFLRLTRVEPGFEPEGAVGLQIFLARARYSDDASQVRFFERLLDEARTLPDLRAVGAASAVPLKPEGQNLLPFEIEGSGHPDTKGVFASFSSATPGYFQAAGIPLRGGRAFTAQDNAASPRVLVVNETMARRFWPGGSPIGKRLRMTIHGDQPIPYEIVGMVGSTRHSSLAEEPEPEIYAPFAQEPNSGMVVVARTSGDPWRVAEVLQSRVYEIDPNQPIFRTFALTDLLRDAGAKPRFYMALFAFFAVVGLTLAVVGLYGVVTHSVARRMHEMSVRIAVGAKGPDILRLIVGDGIKLSLLGVGLGLLAAFGLARLLSSLLYGVGPRDPLTFFLVPLILISVATIASYLPARRALRADPVDALREG